VVRRSRHGGAFARVTGDLFLAPTRAHRELETSLRLAERGVPTPEVVAYAVYPALWPLARADVATRMLPGNDFPSAWQAAPDEHVRRALVHALVALLRQTRDAGALHPDLNLKSVLVTRSGGSATAFLLDVDRVRFGRPGDPAIGERNLRRVLRSARKWRDAWGLDFDDSPLLDAFRPAARVREARPAG